MKIGLGNKAERTLELGGDGPRVAAYLRVSTSRQAKDGVSLDVQRDKIQKMIEQFNPSLVYCFIDLGKSGREFDNRKVANILELARREMINELWVTHVDRIGRNLLDLLHFFVILWKNGVIIRTPKNSYTSKNLSKLLEIILKAYTAEETNNKRIEVSIDSKKRKFKSKIWNKAVPLGYEKKRWLEKIPAWGAIIKECYNYFVLTKRLAPVCRHINRKFSQFLPEPVSRYRVNRILSDPVYVGKPEHMGVVVHDPLLAFVDAEIFSRGQEILEKKRSRHKPDRVSPLKGFVAKYGISALEFIHNLEYHHKSCGGLVVKNGTRIVDGIRRQTFLCKKCEEQFWVPSNSQINRIQNSAVSISIHPLVYCSSPSKTLKQDKNNEIKTNQGKRNAEDKQVSLCDFEGSQGYD